MNNDLISRSGLIKQLEEMANDEWNKQVGSSKGLEDAIDVIDNAPTVEAFTKDEYEGAYLRGYVDSAKANERPTGKWIDYNMNKWIYAQCPECKYINNVKTNYCPDCGMKMEEEK